MLDDVLGEVRKLGKDICSSFEDEVPPKWYTYGTNTGANVVKYYEDIVPNQMFLKKIDEKLKHKSYQDRHGFLADMQQIVDNSAAFNGEDSNFTNNARKMLEAANSASLARCSDFERVEREIQALAEREVEISRRSIKRSRFGGKQIFRESTEENSTKVAEKDGGSGEEEVIERGLRGE